MSDPKLRLDLPSRLDLLRSRRKGPKHTHESSFPHCSQSGTSLSPPPPPGLDNFASIVPLPNRIPVLGINLNSPETGVALRSARGTNPLPSIPANSAREKNHPPDPGSLLLQTQKTRKKREALPSQVSLSGQLCVNLERKGNSELRTGPNGP